LWDKSDGLWTQSVALWGEVARRFADSPYIAGYDVINEAKAPDTSSLHSFYQDVIDAIRKHDPNHIIILEVDVQKELEHQIGGSYDDDNVMVSFHFYYPRNFTLEPSVPGLTYPGTYCARNNLSGNCEARLWNRQTLEQFIDIAINLEELKGKPIFVGEFGAHASRDPDGLRWIEDMLSIMNEKGLHYTYHNYRHRFFEGYWIIKPETSRFINQTLSKLGSNELIYEDISTEQKEMFKTENGYYRREGIKELVTKYFSE
jgi:hypothetical protein